MCLRELTLETDELWLRQSLTRIVASDSNDKFDDRCYATAMMESKEWSLPAPFGGFAFIGAWATLLF